MQHNISEKPVEVGDPAFSREEMLEHLDEFAEIYSRRPIDDNHGGMKAPQAFHAWYVAKKLQPVAIIESGIWYGQGTWFFEQACPDAKIICIDPDMSRLKYKSDKAHYVTHDFNMIDWSSIDLDRSNILCFFDDHQNALSRLPNLKKYGFKHVMFEDNYPVGQGDCVSLKTVLETKDDEEKIVRDHLEIYQEMPPPVSAETTRWGDAWSNYPTYDSLITNKTDKNKCYFDGAENYTWICYGRMK